MSNMWFKETEKDIEELQITQEDIEECLPPKKEIKKCPRFSGKPQEEDRCYLDLSLIHI